MTAPVAFTPPSPHHLHDVIRYACLTPAAPCQQHAVTQDDARCLLSGLNVMWLGDSVTRTLHCYMVAGFLKCGSRPPTLPRVHRHTLLSAPRPSPLSEAQQRAVWQPAAPLP